MKKKKKKKIGHSSTIDVSRENMNKKYVELNIVICVSIGQFCDIVRLNNYFEQTVDANPSDLDKVSVPNSMPTPTPDSNAKDKCKFNFFTIIFAIFWHHGVVVIATVQLCQQSLNLTILTNQSNLNQSSLCHIGSLQW